MDPNETFRIIHGKHFEDIEEEHLFKNPAIENLISEITGKPFVEISYQEFVKKKDKR